MSLPLYVSYHVHVCIYILRNLRVDCVNDKSFDLSSNFPNAFIFQQYNF